MTDLVFQSIEKKNYYFYEVFLEKLRRAFKVEVEIYYP